MQTKYRALNASVSSSGDWGRKLSGLLPRVASALAYACKGIPTVTSTPKGFNATY